MEWGKISSGTRSAADPPSGLTFSPGLVFSHLKKWFQPLRMFKHIVLFYVHLPLNLEVTYLAEGSKVPGSAIRLVHVKMMDGKHSLFAVWGMSAPSVAFNPLTRRLVGMETPHAPPPGFLLDRCGNLFPVPWILAPAPLFRTSCPPHFFFLTLFETVSTMSCNWIVSILGQISPGLWIVCTVLSCPE